MPCAVGHAIGCAVAAEVEVGRADGTDRPAALARREIEQRAGLGAHYIRHHRLGGEQRLERESLGEDVRPVADPDALAHTIGALLADPDAGLTPAARMRWEGVTG